MKKYIRTQTGGMLVLIMVAICLIFVPLLMIISQFGLFSVDKTRIQTVVEAAGLVAANDLSRIIINDPNFGYVSLSNHPPIGKGTCAEDGEPLPVTGINTLVGTVRQNTILASELRNDTLTSLTAADHTALQATVKELNRALSSSLSNGYRSGCVDIQGDKVDPIADVQAFLKTSLPNNVHVQSIHLTNGWLESDGTTTIQIPQPTRLAQIKGAKIQGGNYRPFADLPIGNDSFTFAGAGSSSAIVTASAFRPADAKHICSIVKLDCTLVLSNPPSMPYGNHAPANLECVSCSQPYSLPDVGPGGAMTLRFTGGPVSGMQSWNDFLTANFHDHAVNSYDAVGGDFQIDKDARMRRLHPDIQSTTAQIFAEHLYYWLRNGRLRPRLDAVLQMVSEPFQCSPNDIYSYEFAKDGTISRRVLAHDPFPVGVTADAQCSTFADTTLPNGSTPMIVFRNSVKHLGTISGGKHAGQPLAGYPINWCELQDYSGDEQIALKLDKGRLGTGLSILDPTSLTAPALAINNPSYNLFAGFTGKSVTLQPRKSYYSGGLAVDIQIGGMLPSTAHLDVARMRKLKR